MDRNEYTRRLRHKLSALPPEEIENAVQYYEEYFDEAGAENEQTAIRELGSPEKVASMIKANYAIKDMEQSKGSTRKGIKTVFIIILAIFASPIAIPIAIALFAVLFAIIISLLAIFFSIFVGGIAAGISGIAMIIGGFMVLFQSPATFMFLTGSGLCAGAIGAALVLVTAYISKICFIWIAGALGKLLIRREEK